MAVINLYEFLEIINTECSLISTPPPSIPVKAFRVDGENGLKLKIGCQDLKSCDYLKFRKNYLIMIEFSDLYEQLFNVNLVHTAMDSTINNIFLKERAKKLKILPKNSEDILRIELEQKISQSLNLITVMKKQLNKTIKSQKKVFLVLVCKEVSRDIQYFDSIVRKLNSKFKNVIKIQMYKYTELETVLSSIS